MRFEEALISVWRQMLVENAGEVEIDGERFPVRRTPKLGLREVDFKAAGEALHGIEQNPRTRSRWAQLASEGAKIMQFTAAGSYVANVAEGNVTLYRPRAGTAVPHPGAKTPSV